jgi:hypothetical protein
MVQLVLVMQAVAVEVAALRAQMELVAVELLTQAAEVVQVLAVQG